MTARRAPIAELPDWPRMLSRDEAARYVGVCVETFDREVKQGRWPAAIRRGEQGARLTWDRSAIDRAADRESGLGIEALDLAAEADDWGERSNGPARDKRHQRRPAKAA